MTPRNRIARYFATPAPAQAAATQATAEPPITVPVDPREWVDHLRGLLTEADAVVAHASQAFQQAHAGAPVPATTARTLAEASQFAADLRAYISSLAWELLDIAGDVPPQGD
jgi:hypothetical protein